MSWTTNDIPDLAGRTAVVTGANGGLGLETARALAHAGAHVVMAARDQFKAASAETSIREQGDVSLEVVPLDLGSLASVREAAGRVLADHHQVDLLVNNAHLRKGYSPWKAYGQSKLANFHFAIGLQRRFEAAGAPAASLVAHPGLSNTDLQATSVEQTGGGLSQRFFHSLAGSTGMTAAQGALPQLRAATDPAARGGEFYAPRFGNFGAPVRRPILRRVGLGQAIERLWQVSGSETELRIGLAP
jgi:NAD(P)-dependent dehydrogenase (short-subunit alcohol dehydrogenase family)